jgi:predicted HicB family RNase H-like nuclease
MITNKQLNERLAKIEHEQIKKEAEQERKELERFINLFINRAKDTTK